jgi:transcriptional regulator with XRE-family HTH domain
MPSSLPKIEEDNLREARPEPTPLVSRGGLCRRLARGPQARAQFVESTINKGLAYQLRAMREARNWSQEELAALVGMPQTAISRLESPSYGKPTITTLKRLARVYDVGLDVRFVPFSLLIDRMSKTPRTDMGLTSDSVDVPGFDEEEEQGVF